MTIDERTQELVKLQLGELILACARLRAELEAAHAELAKLKAPEPPA